MPDRVSFGEIAGATITILVDNRTDLLAKSTETVKYKTDELLIAEHGFAALVDLPAEGTRILWDAGPSPRAALENMARLKLDSTTITKIALSHGHDDHTTGLTEILRAMQLRPEAKKWEANVTMAEIRRYAEGRRVPVVIHPAAFRERWSTPADGTKSGPGAPPPRGEWEAAGAEIMLAEGPTRLSAGCWTTGAIPRTSFETAGVSASGSYREGERFVHDSIEDDQALVLNVKGKGLVVLSGCAHAGIVNTVRYAQEISGVSEVWAVLGGFHLAKAKPEEIQQTIDEIERCAPKLIAPTHCTGFEAMRQFATRMPSVFVQGLTGMTLNF